MKCQRLKTVTEMKSVSDGLISTLDMAEDMSIGTSKTEKQRKKDWKKNPSRISKNYRITKKSKTYG